MACLLIVTNLMSQKKELLDENQPCSYFLAENCGFKEPLVKFELNSQSKSALCKRGETYTMNIICYKGMDYRFAFCANSDLLEGKDLNFRIYEKKNKKLIYDNANSNFDNEFEFSCTNSISITIEVILPKTQPVPEQKFEYKGCVVTLIHSRRSLKTGF